MNRRRFLGVTAAVGIARVSKPTWAVDSARVESPLMHLFRSIPDRAAVDGLSFPPTFATNHLIKRGISSESPEMYWDPYGEDLRAVLGFNSPAISYSLAQSIPQQLELWSLDTRFAVAGDVVESLKDNGWTIEDQELRLLEYSGTEEERAELAVSMNLAGETIRNGGWDSIALPDDNTMVLGADADLVGTIADRVKFHTAMTTLDQQFHGMGSVLPVDTYDVALLPPELLASSGVDALFVAKSWQDQGRIIHSIGLRLQNDDLVESLVDEVPKLMAVEISPTRNAPYVDFLELVETHPFRSAVRFDFIVRDGDWDVIDAAGNADLLMLPRS